MTPAAPGADTIYNGADDDASGSIAVLELAEAFVKGARPKRTIVFGWFGSEESGGTGSRYFADKAVVPLDKIVANLQFEMIGRPDAKVPPHTLWLTGYERSTLGPELAKRGAKLVQDPHPDQSFFTRSDNIQFARRGVIAHTVSSFGLHKDYHQASDEIGTIDFAAHDRLDPLDGRTDPLAGELVVQAGLAAGTEAAVALLICAGAPPPALCQPSLRIVSRRTLPPPSLHVGPCDRHLPARPTAAPC